ncbi:MAG: DUF4291 domain-containing protein [Desulfobacterales bacterium]|nr:DUF4291 domain-containing protein [Desulfobacterales bacterium]
MSQLYEIRASFDRDTIVIYQAYRDAIAKPALEKQAFVSPFSLKRMTWIKPSFNWIMHRSNWGLKSGQENILAVHIKRSGWEKALSLGVLTSPENSVFKSGKEWEKKFKNAKVHIQWDTERSKRGAALGHFSIQVGLSSQIIEEYVNDWIVKIEDFTPTVRKLHGFIKNGNTKNFNRLHPKEKIYPVPENTKKQLMIK